MGDYRRMGHVEQHLGNATLMHQLRDLWRSPRGAVLRIEALALVAIAASFFLATFGSCRRWSSRWILQKGFLAANVLFLSLGTYSIGLMQSSSLKSEIYPIWAVSLLALLCFVDSVTTYSLDSSSQFWKTIYQLCLYVGYVLLMSISTISSDLGNIAVGVLSAITFMKGFHRTLALVLPGRMRSMIRAVPDCWGQEIGVEIAESVTLGLLVVHFSLHNVEPRSTEEDATMKWDRGGITLREIYSRLEDNDLAVLDVDALKDVCLSLSLSHLLQRRFLGFNRVLEIKLHDNLLVSSWILLKRGDGSIDYDRAFKVVELELAFLYDVLFTSNAFLQYYEAKTANFWAVTSVAGICFVGVVAAIPWVRTSAHTPGGTIVTTTTGDLAVTGVILVSLALLQILQLLNCWTSNWARVAFACDRVRNQKKKGPSWQMRLRLSLSKINWFRKYLWQNRLGQYSLVELISTRECNLSRKFKGCLYQAYSRFSGPLGLHYFEQMLQELLGNSTGDAIGLHADVKASIAEYVSRIRSHHVSLLDARRCLDVTYDLEPQEGGGTANKYARHLLTWHIATCYCELAQQHEEGKGGFLKEQCTDSERATLERNHRVATALSKYCAYLVVSVPRLLPGPYMEYKYAHDEVAGKAGEVLRGVKDKLGSMHRAVKMGLLGRAKYHLCEITRLILECRETLRSAMDDIAASESELRDKVWKRWNTTTGREVQFWQLLKDELGAMENKNGSGVMGMEDGREALLQVKAQVERAAIERERGRGEVSSWVFDCLRPGAGAALLQVQVKLAALIEENERITQALRSAIDKLDAVEKEMERGGVHRYNPDAGLGSRIFYSGLYLGYRLWSQPAPERWKKLADLWVRALVFAAPSDNVEEHMQRLLQGGEFITHLWALFYHHGVLRWHEEEIEYDYVFWPTQGEEGATRIYAGGDGSREPYEYY